MRVTKPCIVIILISLLLVSCNTKTDELNVTETLDSYEHVICPTDEVNQYVTEMQPVIDEFEEAVSDELRYSLSDFNQKLQEIRKSASNIENPECAKYVHEMILIAMDSGVSSVKHYLDDEWQDGLNNLEVSTVLLQIAVEELEYFSNSPEAAYESIERISETLQNSCDQSISVETPRTWRDIDVPLAELTFSIPYYFEYVEEETGVFYFAGSFNVVGLKYDSWESKYDEVTLYLTGQVQRLHYGNNYAIMSYSCKSYNRNNVFFVEITANLDSIEDPQKIKAAYLVAPNDQNVMFTVMNFQEDSSDFLEKILGSFRIVGR